MSKKGKKIAKKLSVLTKAEAAAPQCLSRKQQRRKSKEIAKQLESMGIADQNQMAVTKVQQQYTQNEEGKFVVKPVPKIQVKNMNKNLVRKIRQMPITTIREFMAIDGQKFRDDMAQQNADAAAHNNAQIEAAAPSTATPATETEVQ